MQELELDKQLIHFSSCDNMFHDMLQSFLNCDNKNQKINNMLYCHLPLSTVIMWRVVPTDITIYKHMQY